jgi:hypothetical protein
LELVKRASEILRTYQKDFVPLVFLGKHDPEEQIKKTFQEILTEIGGGSPRLLVDEIVKYLQNANEGTPSWNIKRQVALAIQVRRKAM